MTTWWLEKRAQTSPGWPAFAGHDNFVVILTRHSLLQGCLTRNTFEARNDFTIVAACSARLILAAAVRGMLVSAVLLTASLLLADDRSLTIVRTLYGVTNAVQTFGFVLVFLAVFGALPAIAIGFVLRLVRRASPVTLVLTPAILFALTLVEIAREMREASLVRVPPPRWRSAAR